LVLRVGIARCACWHELKTILLDAAAVRSIPVSPLNSSLEGLRSYLKMMEQLTKTTERIHTLSANSKDEEAQPADAAWACLLRVFPQLM
jgi:hypothetical protein